MASGRERCHEAIYLLPAPAVVGASTRGRRGLPTAASRRARGNDPPVAGGRGGETPDLLEPFASRSRPRRTVCRFLFPLRREGWPPTCLEPAVGSGKASSFAGQRGVQFVGVVVHARDTAGRTPKPFFRLAYCPRAAAPLTAAAPSQQIYALDLIPTALDRFSLPFQIGKKLFFFPKKRKIFVGDGPKT